MISAMTPICTSRKAHRHRVDTGGETGHRQTPEAMVLAGVLVFRTVVRPQAVDDHVHAQRTEQAERDPVIEGLNILQRGAAEQPADHRRDAFDDAENEAGAQRIGETWLAHRRAFADRRSEGIGGHGKADQQDRNR